MISAIAKKPLKSRIDYSSSVIQCSPYQAVTGKLYCLKQHFLLPVTAWSVTKIQYTHKLFKKISKLRFKPILTRKGSKCRKAKSIVFSLITLFKCWLIPFKALQANNFFFMGFCLKSWRFQGVGGMTSTPWNGNSWRMGDLRQKRPLSVGGGGGGGEYGLYNLSNIVENILALNPKELYLSEEKKKKNLFSSVHVLHKAGAWNKDVSCFCPAMVAKKCTKKHLELWSFRFSSFPQKPTTVVTRDGRGIGVWNREGVITQQTIVQFIQYSRQLYTCKLSSS